MTDYEEPESSIKADVRPPALGTALVAAMDWRHLLKLLVALVAMAVSGTLYAFGAYSSDLRDAHGLTDGEVSRISSLANVGFCFAIFVGLVSDLGGPKLCVACGGIIAATGFLLARAAVRRDISDSWGSFAGSLSLVGQGSTFVYMAALVSYRDFPKPLQGVIIGTLDCMFGFSAAIFTLIYDHGFGGSHPNLSGFFTCCACSVGAAAVAGIIVFKRPQGAAVESTGERQQLLPNAVAVGLPPKAQPRQLQHAPLDEAKDQEAAVEGGSEGGAGLLQRLGRLLSVRYVTLFFVFMIGQGVALQFINNAGDIATAAKPGDDLSSTLSLAASIAGGCMRFGLGLLCDLFKARQLPVTIILIAVYATLVVAQLVLLTDFSSSIVGSAVLTGIAFGGQWCVVPIVTSMYFDEAAFGLNWGILICSSCAGPWIFQPYQAHVYSDNTDGSGSCIGADCYHKTWLVTLAASIVALLLTVSFHFTANSKTARGHTDSQV